MLLDSGHSGRRIPHPLNQAKLQTAKSNSQEMFEHELSAERTGLESQPQGVKGHGRIYAGLKPSGNGARTIK